MNVTRVVAAALCAALLWIPRAALAQSVGITPGTEAVKPFPPPAWAMYYNLETGTYVKPILGISGGLNLELPRNKKPDGTAEPLERVTTALALAIVGVEGRLHDWATLHLEFRRDAGNYGTSVWEGTVSITSLDNYLRLEHWGFKLAGGIVSDPASMDFFSVHMTDLFMADSLSRTPLLYSGYNRGQGLLAQYEWNGLTAGLFFSAGSPLSTTLSYAFGGNVSGVGSLITVPGRGMENGNPAPGFEFDALCPSLSFDSSHFSARANVQLHWVNLNNRSEEDVGLRGELYRFGVKGKVWQDRIQPFFNLAYRRNDMIDQNTVDPTTLDPKSFQSMVVSGGIDLNLLGASGVGANYAYVRRKQGALDTSEWHYLNFGATYWLVDSVSVSLRYSKLMTFTDGRVADNNPDKDSFFLVLRLVI
ncbi:MAG: hypothetical protein HY901_07615 [Deltaproteobacteria bacterium]|nr:hypothetical protein [Deltaproteobacteria bacterium]